MMKERVCGGRGREGKKGEMECGGGGGGGKFYIFLDNFCLR